MAKTVYIGKAKCLQTYIEFCKRKDTVKSTVNKQPSNWTTYKVSRTPFLSHTKTHFRK